MPDSLTTETLTTTTDNTTTDKTDLTSTETNTDNSDPQATESTDSLYPADTSNPSSEADNLIFDDTASPDKNLDNSQENVPAISNSGGNVINVDSDFGGNLQSAIAAASNGDVVKLGSRTYTASGVKIDKDITLDGEAGTVIDGGGSADSILNITQDADGATIQNLELTNANIGIYTYGAENLTVQNVDVNNIGLTQTDVNGQSNTGMVFNSTNGLQVTNCDLSDIGRKGIGVGDSVGAVISDVSVENVNLADQHARNHDVAGVKFYNTTDSVIQNSYFSNIHGNALWPDTTTGTILTNNTVEGVKIGEDISGVYNEKSPNSRVSGNTVTGVDGHVGLDATELTTETLDLGENNFSNQLLGSTDYFVDPAAETMIANEADPSKANFDLISAAYSQGSVMG
jgi:hypothetical protein